MGQQKIGRDMSAWGQLWVWSLLEGVGGCGLSVGTAMEIILGGEGSGCGLIGLPCVHWLLGSSDALLSHV